MVDLAEFEFLDAVQQAALEKDMGPLIRLLRADYPLSAEDKCSLADLLAGKIKRRRGARRWRATDELAKPNEAAVRRAARLIAWVKKGRPRNGHEQAVQQVIDYMNEKGWTIPNRQSLENFLRRSKQPKKKRSTKS